MSRSAVRAPASVVCVAVEISCSLPVGNRFFAARDRDIGARSASPIARRRLCDTADRSPGALDPLLVEPVPSGGSGQMVGAGRATEFCAAVDERGLRASSRQRVHPSLRSRLRFRRPDVPPGVPRALFVRKRHFHDSLLAPLGVHRRDGDALRARALPGRPKPGRTDPLRVWRPDTRRVVATRCRVFASRGCPRSAISDRRSALPVGARLGLQRPELRLLFHACRNCLLHVYSETEWPRCS